MKLFNTIAASVAVAMAVGVAQADDNSQLANLQAQVNQLQAQVNGMNSGSAANLVGVNSGLSWQMMSNESGVGREMNLLNARQAGWNTPLTIGGFLQADAIYQHSSQPNAFANSGINANVDTADTSATRLFVSNAALATTVAMGDYATGYVQVDQTNVGDASGSTFGVHNAYLVLGNLANAPVYGFVGKKDIDFGSFATVDMYNSPLTRQLFSEIGNTAGVGVNAYGFNGVVSIMNGGGSSYIYNNQNSGSTYVTPYNGTYTGHQGMYTTSNNFGKNYAVNLSYGMTNSGVNWNVGAGYVNATQFGSDTNGSNGAWDVNGKASVANFDFLAEYVMTAKDTNIGALSGTSNSRVNAWSLGADYNFPVMGYESKVSAEYSQAKTNSVTSQPKQVVVGYEVEPVKHVWTGIEYSYNNGLLNVPTTQSLTNNTVLLDVTTAF